MYLCTYAPSVNLDHPVNLRNHQNLHWRGVGEGGGAGGAAGWNFEQAKRQIFTMRTTKVLVRLRGCAG